MKHGAIRTLLSKSLEDRSLSRGEAKTLKALLDDARASAGDRRALIAHAFELARTEAGDPSVARVLSWLESVSVALVAERRADEAASRGLAEVFFSPGDSCRRRIESLFAGAKQTADVCVFTITDDRIAAAVLDAHRRGVRIRVVSDDEKAADPGSDLERLRVAGVAVAFDDSPYHMHHKFALFDDGIVLAGSYNWTRAAADVNEEDLVVSDEARLIRAFRAEFDRLWKRFAGRAS